MSRPPGWSRGSELAAQIHEVLKRRGETVAVAESLTGGLLGATYTSVPGASATFRGGVTAYATLLKVELLGVPEPLLAAQGAVSPDVAAAMAAGARDRLGATFGLALTGVAGPDPQDGHPVGEVHVGLAGPEAGVVRSLRLPGDRAAIRTAAVEDALALLRDVLLGEPATEPATEPPGEAPAPSTG